MQYPIVFERYEISLGHKADGKRLVEYSPQKGKATAKEGHKLYLVCNGKQILYVGETSMSIKSRFGISLNRYHQWKSSGKAEGGYKGYKWLNPKLNSAQQLHVFVAIFDEREQHHDDLIEAVEGELVLLIRNRSGRWPEYQNEIHFHNVDGAIDIATNILAKFDSGGI
jgi:hypothetical protein